MNVAINVIDFKGQELPTVEVPAKDKFYLERIDFPNYDSIVSLSTIFLYFRCNNPTKGATYEFEDKEQLFLIKNFSLELDEEGKETGAVLFEGALYLHGVAGENVRTLNINFKKK